MGKSGVKTTTKVTRWAVAGVLIVLAVILAFMVDPFQQSPLTIVHEFKTYVRGAPYPFALFVLITGVGSLLLIPINIFLVAAALLFPGWKGFFCGLSGALLASVLQYLIGRYLINSEFLEEKLSERFKSIRARISENGLAAMTFLSLVPIAPHIVNNLIAGVCRVRMLDLLVGTTVGFIPGLLVINMLGRSVRRFVANPNMVTASLVAAVLIAMLVLARLIQLYFARKQPSHDVSSTHRFR